MLPGAIAMTLVNEEALLNSTVGALVICIIAHLFYCSAKVSLVRLSTYDYIFLETISRYYGW